MGEPTEYQHACWLAQWLRARGVVFHCTMNETPSRAQGQKGKRMGVWRGIPDFLIFSRPEGMYMRRNLGLGVALHECGIAIELKRPKPRGRLTEHQKQALATLEGLGWIAFTAWGWQEAVARLEGLGF